MNEQLLNVDVPLCIDCDGTLLRTDLLHEGVIKLLRKSPLLLFLLPIWLLRGKAYLKEQISARVDFEWASMPYTSEILQLIKKARESGRKVVLATASPVIWANGIASHLGVFDQVFATQNGLNLSRERKANLLVEAFGYKKFDYAGNGPGDFAVWNCAKSGIVVSSTESTVKTAQSLTHVLQIVNVQQPGLFTYLKSVRIHQWLKNLLILVPLLAAHKIQNAPLVMQAVLAFFAFNFCASAVYVINDLLDLESDRQHIRKCNRPFASAVIPIWKGILMIPCLLAAAFFLSWSLPLAFNAVLVAYFGMTLIYSLRLKRQVMVDVMLLAALYTVRIIAGAAATAIVPSFWLLAFSMFIFLSLAIVKRYSELYITLQQLKEIAAGRGYTVNDLPVLASIGASAGMAAVLVLALYINDLETALLYPERMWLWLVPPLILYWVSRIWLKTCRGEIDDDPVIFAIKDWQSLIVGLLLSFCFVLASVPGSLIFHN